MIVFFYSGDKGNVEAYFEGSQLQFHSVSEMAEMIINGYHYLFE